MKIFIITGTSRGLGEAIALKLLNENHYLICVSRKPNQKLISLAKENNYPLNYMEYDLSQVDNLETMISNALSEIDFEQVEAMSLVNNAGVLGPVKSIDKWEGSEIVNSFHVNIIAPVILSSKFIEMSRDFNIEKRIINISSGAGRHPYDGWSCYCSTKAAMDHFTRCVAVEQEKTENPVKILSIAPGVMDTKMQEEIRSSSSEDFSKIDKFIQLKNDDSLLSTDTVADKIIDLLFKQTFVQGGILDVRDPS